MKKWVWTSPLCPLFKGKRGPCKATAPLIGVWGERCEGWLAFWGGDSGTVMGWGVGFYWCPSALWGQDADMGSLGWGQVPHCSWLVEEPGALLGFLPCCVHACGG